MWLILVGGWAFLGEGGGGSGFFRSENLLDSPETGDHGYSEKSKTKIKRLP